MPDLLRELSPVLVAALVCPVCGQALRILDGAQSLVCAGAVTARNPKGKTHCFDGAAAGYVPLAPRHSGGGDSREAVRARTAFLSGGYYAPAAEALVEAVRAVTPVGGCVLDAGCGEGYYSNRLAAAGYETLGIDLSKFAVEAAAKGARAARMCARDTGVRMDTEPGQPAGSMPQTTETPENRCGGSVVLHGDRVEAAVVKNVVEPPAGTLFAVGSVFELPVADRTMDAVTNIFAPCVPAEYARVLKPGGHLIVAGAGERHLMGLKEAVYDDPYLNDPRRDLPAEDDPLLSLTDRCTCAFTITVEGREAIAALFSMTPYYWRTPRESHERLAALDRLTTEIVFDIHVYKKH